MTGNDTKECTSRRMYFTKKVNLLMAKKNLRTLDRPKENALHVYEDYIFTSTDCQVPGFKTRKMDNNVIYFNVDEDVICNKITNEFNNITTIYMHSDCHCISLCDPQRNISAYIPENIDYCIYYKDNVHYDFGPAKRYMINDCQVSHYYNKGYRYRSDFESKLGRKSIFYSETYKTVVNISKYGNIKIEMVTYQ